MTIEDYKQHRGITYREFADKIGVSAPYLWQIVRGIRRPSPTIAGNIIRATGGKVSYEDIYEVPASEAVGS